MTRISDIRKNYSKKKLVEEKAKADPILQFTKWWDQAIEADIEEVNAMTLATASIDGTPSARIVLLKEYSEKGFIFFTNYESYKGKQLAENPKACLVFFWKELERQIRITGLVSQINSSESEEYFHSRPQESQVGALVSPQSQVIVSREWLEQEYKTNLEQFKDRQVPKPDHWGGYIVKPDRIEFWQGRPGRLHDRLQYSLKEEGQWKIERLAP